MHLESFHNNIKYQVNSISNSRTYISQGIELLKIIFSCDWDFFSTNWEKIHLNLIGNGALFRPLRHPKKIPAPSGALSIVALSKSHFHSSMYIVYICS